MGRGKTWDQSLKIFSKELGRKQIGEGIGIERESIVARQQGKFILHDDKITYPKVPLYEQQSVSLVIKRKLLQKGQLKIQVEEQQDQMGRMGNKIEKKTVRLLEVNDKNLGAYLPELNGDSPEMQSALKNLDDLTKP